MNVQRALKVLPREAELSGECVPNYYGGAWMIWARWTDEDGWHERPVTQFVHPALAARWLHDYDRASRTVTKDTEKKA